MKRPIYLFTLAVCVLLGFALAIGSTIGQGFITGVVSGAGLTVSGYYLNDGTNNYVGPVNQIATLPSAGTYSWINQGTATETTAGNALVVHAPASSSANVRIREALISTNTTLTVALICDTLAGGTNATCVVGFRESATGKLVFQAFQSSGAAASAAYVFFYTNPTTFTLALTNASNGAASAGLGGQIVWVKLTTSGGNITFSYSFDGVNFPVGYTEAANAHFTTGPDQWFYGADSEGATQDTYTVLLSWKTQ